MGFVEADVFSIIYGSIALLLLIAILVMSLKQSIGHKGAHWYKIFWNLKSILLPAIDHIADTVSDLALVIEFWLQSKKELETNRHILDYNASKPNTIIFFILSLIILFVYRAKSAFVVWRISKSYGRCLLQFLFDVELYRAIFINVKLNPKEPISLFKYIRQDECFYESIPQFCLSIVYIIFSGGKNNAIVYFSTFFSLKSFTDRFITFDGLTFKEDANKLHVSFASIKKCRFCSDLKESKRYLLRSIFRFCDITSRLLMLCFVWTVIGYIVFVILIIIEIIISLLTRLCFESKVRDDRIWLNYVALLVYPPGVPRGENLMCKYLPIIQLIRNLFILCVLHFFIFTDFACDSAQFICSDYQNRHKLVTESEFNTTVFVITNVLFVISAILYPIIKEYLLESQLKQTANISSDLWYPARAGDGVDLLANLQYGSDINVMDERKRTALHYAASRGHTEVINILLSYEKALKVNIQDNREWTALHFCVRYAYKNCKNTQGLEAILKEAYNLDINLQTNKGETALILASKSPFPDDVNLKCVAKLLIEKNKEYDLGIDVNMKDKDGFDALYYWSQIGDDEMVQILLDHGANKPEDDTNKEATNEIAINVTK